MHPFFLSIKWETRKDSLGSNSIVSNLFEGDFDQTYHDSVCSDPRHWGRNKQECCEYSRFTKTLRIFPVFLPSLCVLLWPVSPEGCRKLWGLSRAHILISCPQVIQMLSSPVSPASAPGAPIQPSTHTRSLQPALSPRAATLTWDSATPWFPSLWPSGWPLSPLTGTLVGLSMTSNSWVSVGITSPWGLRTSSVMSRWPSSSRMWERRCMASRSTRWMSTWRLMRPCWPLWQTAHSAWSVSRCSTRWSGILLSRWTWPPPCTSVEGSQTRKCALWTGRWSGRGRGVAEGCEEGQSVLHWKEGDHRLTSGDLSPGVGWVDMVGRTADQEPWVLNAGGRSNLGL